MAMTPFKRSAVSNSAQKPRSGGGGGGWFDKWKLPQGSAAPFVFINAEYLDPNPGKDREETGPDGKPLPVKNIFFKFKSHSRKMFRNGSEYFPSDVCSQGWDPHNPKPCAGCMAIDMGDKSVTVSEKFAFGVVHLSPYHRHPQVDYKTGQISMNKDNSGPYFTHSECTGRTCNFCKVKAGQAPVLKPGESFPPFNPADITTEFGHRKYFEIGKGHLQNLASWDGAISNQCGAPILNPQGQLLAKCGQQLTRNSFNCPNCNNVMIDLSTDARNDQDIEAAAATPHHCPTCQKAVLLKEVLSCDACTNAGRQFIKLGIGDVVLWGKREGEGVKSQLSLQQFQTVEEFQRSLPPHIQQLLGGKNVVDVIKELGTPYDFDKVMSPKSLPDQMKKLELNFQVPGVQQTSAYAQPVPQQGFMQPPAAAMGMPQQAAPPYIPQQPAYAPYAPTTTGPGPQPFQPPLKPNFGK